MTSRCGTHCHAVNVTNLKRRPPVPAGTATCGTAPGRRSSSSMGGKRTRPLRRFAITGGTTPPPSPGTRHCGTAGGMSLLGPASSRPRWVGSCSRAGGRAARKAAGPSAPSSHARVELPVELRPASHRPIFQPRRSIRAVTPQTKPVPTRRPWPGLWPRRGRPHAAWRSASPRSAHSSTRHRVAAPAGAAGGRELGDRGAADHGHLRPDDRGPAAGRHLRLGTECSAYCSPGCRSAPEQSDPLHTCDAASLTGAPHRCLQH